MNYFKKLFGIERGAVKKNVILLPFLSKKIKDVLDVPNLTRGYSYSSINTNEYTVIYTGVGAPFVGDAAIYLEESDCENIILFGACGSLSKEFGIGELLLIDSCLESESFSASLENHPLNLKDHRPSSDLLDSALSQNGALKARCISFGSLALEPLYKDKLLDTGAQVIDMECSSLYSAAFKTNKHALAVLYVTDIVGNKPFFSKLGTSDQSKVDLAIEKGAGLIKTILKA